eukprot:TRINITY_DN58887_c0_g1_i1.p1 TRINITY_DN58887_c0_g1~~TRINITY_DN58887_c0_g1_i1.p1  ORF type:complete len:272 (+),score=43.10 TRINITY_DN58887_c0_g1_i1:211-1026(+)
MGYDVLMHTKIGSAVRSIDKDKRMSEAVRDRARSLVDQWKSECRERSRSPKHRRRSDASLLRKSNGLLEGSCSKYADEIRGCTCESDALVVGSDGSSCRDALLKSEAQECQRSAGGSLHVSSKRSRIRNKLQDAVEWAVASLELDAKPAGHVQNLAGLNPADLAAQIESAIHSQLCEKSEKMYVSQCRSVIFNLKDAGNRNFRRKVLLGLLRSEDLPSMSAEEMASDSLREERSAVRREALLAVAKSEPQGEFVCENCGGTLCRRTLGEVR